MKKGPVIFVNGFFFFWRWIACFVARSLASGGIGSFICVVYPSIGCTLIQKLTDDWSAHLRA